MTRNARRIGAAGAVTFVLAVLAALLVPPTASASASAAASRSHLGVAGQQAVLAGRTERETLAGSPSGLWQLPHPAAGVVGLCGAEVLMLALVLVRRRPRSALTLPPRCSWRLRAPPADM